MYITNCNGKEHDEIERFKLKNLESGKTIFKVKYLNGENQLGCSNSGLECCRKKKQLVQKAWDPLIQLEKQKEA